MEDGIGSYFTFFFFFFFLYRSQWIDTGGMIMSDGWRDIRERHLINFLVYCPKGISFIK